MSVSQSSFRSRWRWFTDHAVTGLAILATLLVIAPLVAIFVYLVVKGASSLNLAFFSRFQSPSVKWAVEWQMQSLDQASFWESRV